MPLSDFKMAEQNQEVHPTGLPAEIESWTKDHVKEWALEENHVDNANADILHAEEITGLSLLLLNKSDLRDLGIKLGPAKVLLSKRDELVQLKKDQIGNQSGQSSKSCEPYPFHRYHDAYRYKANSILDVPESGALDFIEPCHKFKLFNNTEEENKMKKFTDEVVRFGAACMNSRTNGTIHFGVGDLPEFDHGQIVGVVVLDKEAFVNGLHEAKEGHFEHKHIKAAKKCIKTPRFVQVLNPDMTSSGKYVIEVDIVPAYEICLENYYYVYSVNKKKARKQNQGTDKDKKEEECKSFYIRDGTSSPDLLVQTSQKKPIKEYKRFIEDIKQLSQLRREAEKTHLTDVNGSVQGSRLSEMLTGGSQSLDKSHFERYLLITNKSHVVQLESLEFLLEMNLTAVLDFDPESEENGLCKYFAEQRKIYPHLPKDYKITEPVEDIAKKLKLTKNTSWVFCNGGNKEEMPSDPDDWLTEKGASVRDVVSFLCRKDVLHQKRFLVVFLLLSSVDDKMDPLLESFSMFWQELGGTEQILCICENEKAFTYWNDLIEARYGLNISARSIYELSLAEINGTVLSLWSDNRRSSRFLPCGGASKVRMRKKMEECLDTLSILCVNQCEGGTEEKGSLEESFYKGGKVSWWNFYFSEQPGSMPFIKRDKYDFIKDTIIPELLSLRQACVSFSLLHLPGCGGTTLAKHILWSLKDKFRCAVLRDMADDFAEVAKQVVELLIYESAERTTRLPVLLMMDDFEELDAVYNLQRHIDDEFVKRDLGFNCPQVILLNCMRTESCEQTEATKDTVFIGNNLSESEQKQFQNKLEEIEKTYKNANTFYGFMIMKKNFSEEYIQGVARNTLKNFNFESKPAQLVAVLTLLNVYCKGAVLSVSLCEEFLGLQTKPCCASKKVEDEFGKFSTLLTRCTVEAKVVYEAIRSIHPRMAECCLQELTNTYNVSRAEILNMLLTNITIFVCTQGKDKLMQDVHNMLVKRYHFEEESRFSPVIQAIVKDTPGAEEMVLHNAAKRFDKDATISQLLARYQYLKKKDFRQAKEWARKAKEISKESSYIYDTAAQVIKHELKHAIANSKDDKYPMTPEKLRDHLKMALSAREAFRETQDISKKEIALRAQVKRDNTPFNTAGYLGEIHVSVIIMDILEKVPVFASSYAVHHNILEQVLSGKTTIQNVCRNDKKQEHAQYYHVLEDFSDLICNLKSTMKLLFNFLDAFFVNLGPRYTQRDKQKERTQQELFNYFCCYVKLFCNSNANEFLMSKNLNITTKILKGWKFLENQKADTHSGILDSLSHTTSGRIEDIVRTYTFNLQCNPNNRLVKNRTNFIYANIVLEIVKPTSCYIHSYRFLLHLLCEILWEPIPHKDSMALHFIAVALLWPEPNPLAIAERFLPELGNYVSQLRTSFWSEMGPVCFAKKPVVHFYLGKKQGYDRLICRAEVERFVSQQSGSLGENEIWKQKEIHDILRRATGVVQRKTILADTPNPAVKIEVNPVYKSQLCGGEHRRVSFFIGFSMQGPLAFDIEFH